MIDLFGEEREQIDPNKKEINKNDNVQRHSKRYFR